MPGILLDPPGPSCPGHPTLELHVTDFFSWVPGIKIRSSGLCSRHFSDNPPSSLCGVSFLWAAWRSSGYNCMRRFEWPPSSWCFLQYQGAIFGSNMFWTPLWPLSRSLAPARLSFSLCLGYFCINRIHPTCDLFCLAHFFSIIVSRLLGVLASALQTSLLNAALMRRKLHPVCLPICRQLTKTTPQPEIPEFRMQIP